MQVFRKFFLGGLKPNSSSFQIRKTLTTEFTKSFLPKLQVTWKTTPGDRLFSKTRMALSAPPPSTRFGASPFIPRSRLPSTLSQTLPVFTTNQNSFELTKLKVSKRLFSTEFKGLESSGTWFEGIPEVAGIFQTAETNYQQQRFLDASRYFGQAITALVKIHRSPDQQKLFNFIISRFLECHGRIGVFQSFVFFE